MSAPWGIVPHHRLKRGPFTIQVARVDAMHGKFNVYSLFEKVGRTTKLRLDHATAQDIRDYMREAA